MGAKRAATISDQTPWPKRRRASTAAATATSPSTLNPSVETISRIDVLKGENWVDPADAPMSIPHRAVVPKSSKRPLFSFGTDSPSDEAIEGLNTCINPGIPLWALVHPEVEKLYDTVKVYSLLFQLINLV